VRHDADDVVRAATRRLHNTATVTNGVADVDVAPQTRGQALTTIARDVGPCVQPISNTRSSACTDLAMAASNSFCDAQHTAQLGTLREPAKRDLVCRVATRRTDLGSGAPLACCAAARCRRRSVVMDAMATHSHAAVSITAETAHDSGDDITTRQ
jgi:hypothetical protein